MYIHVSIQSIITQGELNRLKRECSTFNVPPTSATISLTKTLENILIAISTCFPWKPTYSLLETCSTDKTRGDEGDISYFSTRFNIELRGFADQGDLSSYTVTRIKQLLSAQHPVTKSPRGRPRTTSVQPVVTAPPVTTEELELIKKHAYTNIFNPTKQQIGYSPWYQLHPQYKQAFLQNKSDIVADLNDMLHIACPTLRIEIWFDTKHTHYYINLMRTLIWPMRNDVTVSSIQTYTEDTEDTEDHISFNATTPPVYEGNKYYTVLCIVLTLVMSRLFPNTFSIHAYSVHPATTYLLHHKLGYKEFVSSLLISSQLDGLYTRYEKLHRKHAFDLYIDRISTPHYMELFRDAIAKVTCIRTEPEEESYYANHRQFVDKEASRLVKRKRTT